MLFSKLLRPGLLLALAVCGLLQAPSLYAKDVQRWAILIGVDDYSNINDLEFCGEDQRAMHTQLIESGFKKENIFLLHDQAKEKRYLPFKSNIEKQLQTILKIVGKDDIIVVAFSGHGVRMDGESYFCPTDADLDKPDTLLPIKFIYEQLRGCNASLKLLVIDACRNDPRPRGSRTPRDPTLGFTKALKEARPPLGVVVLSSCTPGEISPENEKLKHGVFMHYVLEGMQGKADTNANGKVTLGELSQYSGRSTKLFVAKTYNDVQRPFLHGELTTDVLHYDLFKTNTSTSLLIAPFSKKQAEVKQAAWAKHLKRKVVETNSVGMKMVLIPSGEFQMGISKSVKELMKLFNVPDEEISDEKEIDYTKIDPQRLVRIPKPFYMGVNEVSVADFRKFVADRDYKTELQKDGEGGYGWNKSEEMLEGPDPKYRWDHPGWDQTDHHPVVNITWNDAVAYCEWLSKQEGVTYRLPTEAEWEYACRAGSQTVFFYGDAPDDLTRFGNIVDHSVKNIFSDLKTTINSDAFVFTAPVGAYQANAFGLYDMHGNVSEMTFSCGSIRSFQIFQTSSIKELEKDFLKYTASHWHQLDKKFGYPLVKMRDGKDKDLSEDKKKFIVLLFWGFGCHNHHGCSPNAYDAVSEITSPDKVSVYTVQMSGFEDKDTYDNIIGRLPIINEKLLAEELRNSSLPKAVVITPDGTIYKIKSGGGFPDGEFAYDVTASVSYLTGNLEKWMSGLSPRRWQQRYQHQCRYAFGMSDHLQTKITLRGGSWADTPQSCRSSFRRDGSSDCRISKGLYRGHNTSGRVASIGFRVVVDSD